ncbi:hypothetical protein P9D28_07780 [Bacillus haynesii]|uniref:hypothetical protein n=1 Tax=Bacillus haynesii TaxID=1925021 RepID=UPI002DB7C153|nr:hypothetical protein [Bacillus haynesii]MEC1552327.1 hypothetical protein [Bacillus haynesii]
MNDIFNFEFYRNIVVSAVTILLFNSIFQYIKHKLERKMGFHNFSMNKKYEVYPQIYSKCLIAGSAIFSCKDIVTKLPNFKDYNKEELNKFLEENLTLLDNNKEDILSMWECSKVDAIKYLNNVWKKNQERNAREKWIDFNNYTIKNDIYLSLDLSDLVIEMKYIMEELLSIYEKSDLEETTQRAYEVAQEINQKINELNQKIKKELKIKK